MGSTVAVQWCSNVFGFVYGTKLVISPATSTSLDTLLAVQPLAREKFLYVAVLSAEKGNRLDARY